MAYRSVLIGCGLTLMMLAPATAGQRFPELFRTLVEADTTLASGSCTAAANEMAAAMERAGFPARGIHPYAAPGHPDEGGLVAILEGSDSTAKALLLVAHIDVVPADPGDWVRPPFKLVESDGYFYGRGVADNKAVAAALIDLLIRLNAEGFRSRRDIKVALTCGEETATAFNGAQYLATERRDLIDAGLALVPSGGAMTDDRKHPISLTIQAGEKAQQNFRLEATGTASHSSRPTANNAILILAEALARLARIEFPVTLTDASRVYFKRIVATQVPRQRDAISRMLADPGDREALAIVTADPTGNAMLRTTCTPTIVQTGTQANTVAPRASANINCRLLPGDTVVAVEAALIARIADPRVTVTAVPPRADPRPSPPIAPDLSDAIEAEAHALWPGVAILPTMLTGATDARHFNAVGIPSFGITILFYDPDGNGVHAPNERIAVRSVDEGRVLLERLVKRLAS